MAKRPQRLIRKTVVKPFFFFVSKPNSSECVLWVIRGDGNMAFGIYDFLVGVTAAVSNPCPSLCSNNRVKGSDHTACRDNIFNLLAYIIVNVRFAVGYNN